MTKANVIRITATIQAIDPTTRSITLRDDEGVEDTFIGRVVTRKVESKASLEGDKPGDKIDITFTQAFLTSVQNAN